MRMLALETTDKTGSVAAMADNNLLAELMLDHTQRSAQSLAPAMSRLLQQVGWQPSDVQGVAVSVGPGSFTGLRVGVTAAKVFAYAVGAEVLGVNTLEAIAANAQSDAAISRLSVVIDAQRGEVVVQSFVRQADGWFEPAGGEELLDADVWLGRLEGSGFRVEGSGFGVQGSGLKIEGSRFKVQGSESSNLQISQSPNLQIPESSNPQSPIPNPSVSRPHPSPPPKGGGTFVTGPGLVRLVDRLPPGVTALDQDYWRPRAAAVARIAARHHALGRRDDLWKLVPHYYRRSAAEEKWEARMAKP